MSKYTGRTTRSFRKMRLRILEMSDICWLCGQAGADTVDHIIPLSLDPSRGEDPTNLLPAHRSCNSSRGAKMPDPKTLNNSRNW
jgi:5-methylcytosine-specific restriction endonuclease McrA